MRVATAGSVSIQQLQSAVTRRLLKNFGAIFFLLLLIVLTINSQAQQTPADSIRRKINAASGQEKVQQLNALSKLYWITAYDSSVYYANRALAEARGIGFKAGIAEAWRNLGVTGMYKKPLTGKPFLDTAFQLFSSLGDKKGLADTYNNFGYMWLLAEKYDSAYTSLENSLRLFRELGDKPGEAAVLNYIGIIHQRRGDYVRGVEYALKGLEIRRGTNDHMGIVFSMINSGNMYLEAGQTDPAIELYTESILYAAEHKLTAPPMVYQQLARSYLNRSDYDSARHWLSRLKEKDTLLMALLFQETHKTDSALFYYRAGYKKAVSASNVRERIIALAGIAGILTDAGHFAEAMPYAKGAYLDADSTKHEQLKGQSAAILSRLYEQMGNSKEAIRLLRESYRIRDSLSGGEFQNRLAFFESRARIDREQARVRVLSAEKALQEQKLRDEQRIRNYTLVIFISALIAALFIILNINRKRAKIQAQGRLIDEQRKNVEQTLTDLRATQSQLIYREKMASLGELTTGLAHEIQNPLNFVNNFSEVNKDLVMEMKTEIEKGNFDEAKEIANDIIINEQKINEHGRRADAIVKNMFHHSKTVAGNKEPADLNQLIDEYLRLTYHGFQARYNGVTEETKSFSVNITTEYDNSIGTVLVLPRELGRVIVNLINNSLYAMHELWKANSEAQSPVAEDSTIHKQLLSTGYKPELFIRTNKMQQKIEITVTDNGTGIPSENIEKVFQPFFTTKPTGQGTGLGLSLAYDIVTKAHGGDIRVESQYGEQTSFTVVLPC